LRRCRFLAQVGDFGDGDLHARREFVAADARGQGVIAGALRLMSLVERLHEIARRTVGAVRHFAGGKEVVDRRAVAAHCDALMAGGQEAVGPVDRAARGLAARVGDDDECRQVLRLTAETVGEPRSQSREAVEAKAGVLLKRRRRVIRSLGDHRVDDRQFIRNLGDFRE
jgi:hypothetical protein